MKLLFPHIHQTIMDHVIIIILYRVNIGYDIDPNALEVCRENLEQYDLENDVELVNVDIAQLAASLEAHQEFFDDEEEEEEEEDEEDDDDHRQHDTEQAGGPPGKDQKDQKSQNGESESVNETKGNLNARGGMARTKVADIVISNPPFGTRNKGIDMLFVRQNTSQKSR